MTGGLDVEHVEAIRQGFHENGFFIFKGLLTPEAAATMRGYIAEQFSPAADTQPYDLLDNPVSGSIKLNIYQRYPEIYRELFFNSHFVTALKIILGDDFCIFPDTGIHKNGFGPWHKDTNSQQTSGLTCHFEQDYLITSIAIYFQDNTLEYGGGLEVLPKSQDIYWSHKANFPHYGADHRGVLLPSASGDMVIFTDRLDHRASPAALPVTNERTKYAAFFNAGRNNAHAQTYLSFIKRRPIYTFLQDFSYPEDLQEHARANGYALLK